MKFLKLFFILLTGIIFSNDISAQGVVISDDPNATVADESAVLDIQSTSKGMLIPRMTTAQRNSISNAKDGLLVFDITEGSFYLYGKSKWTDLSTPADLWTVENSNVRLTNTNFNLDIGNSVTTNNMIIQADENTSSDDPIFEVKDKTGKPVMQITSEGVKIFVSEQAKGVSGGFAVGRYATAKGGMDTTYFTVNKEEGTRVYTSGSAVTSGGFAVGRYATAKGMDNLLFSVKENQGTRAYTFNTAKGVAGGFAVGRYTGAKGMDTTYFTVNKDEGTRVYTSGGSAVTSGGFAVGRYATAKGMDTTYFSVNRDEGTQILQSENGNGFSVNKYINSIKKPIFIANNDSIRIYFRPSVNSKGFACIRDGVSVNSNDWAYNLYIKNTGELSYDSKTLLIGGGQTPSQSMTFPTDRGNNNAN